MGWLSKLDPWLYRYPFEGASARRYAQLERCGFGDLDERLVAAWDAELRAAESFLDIGCGPATLASRIAASYPGLRVTGVEPSRDFASQPAATFCVLRARAESLPLPDKSISMATYLSSIRHVLDRPAAFAELRRVLRDDGVCYIVELDPTADARRCRRHVDGLRSRWLSLTFGPLVLRTAPPAANIAAMARTAGFSRIELRDDPVQPVYVMRLAS